MEPAVVDGNGTETGHIIVTTIGGRNGQPKQVNFDPLNSHNTEFVNFVILLFIILYTYVIRQSVTWPSVLWGRDLSE